jgi:hypothetical protein
VAQAPLDVVADADRLASVHQLAPPFGMDGAVPVPWDVDVPPVVLALRIQHLAQVVVIDAGEQVTDRAASRVGVPQGQRRSCREERSDAVLDREDQKRVNVGTSKRNRPPGAAGDIRRDTWGGQPQKLKTASSKSRFIWTNSTCILAS